MKIAVDCDGVLAEFKDAFLSFINQKYGTNLTREDIKRYRFHENPAFPIKTREEERKEVREFAEQGLYKTLKPIEEAKSVLERLKEENEFRVFTQRPKITGILSQTED